MKVLGLCGLRGSGKSTVGSMISKALPERTPVLECGFADGVREVARRVYGLTAEEMGDPVKKELPVGRLDGLTPRFIMQRIGTEVARSIHSDSWVWMLKDRIERFRILAEPQDPDAPEPWVIITDVRYQNEVDLVNYLGGKVWVIERGGQIVDKNAHPSERPDLLTGWHFKLFNNSDLENLSENVDIAMRLYA